MDELTIPVIRLTLTTALLIAVALRCSKKMSRERYLEIVLFVIASALVWLIR